MLVPTGKSLHSPVLCAWCYFWNMKANQPLEDQCARVTGAGTGIGAAIAGALAAAGATVVINYAKSGEAAEKVADGIRTAGGQALTVRADVSHEPDVQAMFAKTIETFGSVDILVNNAGTQRDAPLLEMSLADWQHVIAVNLTGQFLCAREAAREFLRRGVVAGRSRAAGKIICISSVHQRIPWAGHINYAASKGGVAMLMESLAQELAPQRVRVNSIAPGAIKTGINREAWATPEEEARLLQLIPYGRVGATSDVAKAAVWLASDDSDYVTGATLYIDGGMTLYPAFRGNG